MNHNLLVYSNRFTTFLGRLKYPFVKSYKNDGITKFIMLTRSRTGSTFLTRLLNQHPNITCRVEEFVTMKGETIPRRFNRIFKGYNWPTKAVGCKIFYYHPQDQDPVELQKFISKNPDFKVIHMVRKNTLRIMTSQAIAKKTGQWFRMNGMYREIPLEKRKVTLDPKECEQEFKRTKQFKVNYPKALDNNDLFELEYEDLNKDVQGQMTHIFKFLGLKDKTVKQTMAVQNPEPLNELLENYNELKAYFEGTVWEEFFVE